MEQSQKINKLVLLNRFANLLILTILFVYYIPAFSLSFIIGIIIKIIIVSSPKIGLYYEFDNESRSMYECLKEVLILLSNNKKIWQINTSVKVYNKRYNAGAGNSISRNRAYVTNRLPFYIKTNINIYGLKLKNQTMFFTPDRVIIFRPFRKAFGCTYNNMFLGVDTIKYIESEMVCKDSTVSNYTWQYANNDGSRDLRFSNNKRYPVCEYGELKITSPSGINTIIEFSNKDLNRDIQLNLVLFGNTFNKILAANKEKENQIETETIDNDSKEIAGSKEINTADLKHKVSEEKKKINAIENNVINYQLPKISLLSYKKLSKLNTENIEEKIKSLNEIFNAFKVKAKVEEVNIGPRYTYYNVSLTPGTKLNSITSLDKEIALNLAVRNVDIEISSRTKNSVSIIIPNDELNPVEFKDVMEHISKYTDSCKDFDSELKDMKIKGILNDIPYSENLYFALGKKMNGEKIFGNLCNVTNVLIAGSTGSGISMFLNSLILSLLMNYTPNEIRLILYDSKKVEFSNYSDIPHLLYPVLDNTKKLNTILQRMIFEIKNRQELFKKNGVKDILEYNKNVQHTEKASKLPRILIIIDDIADLVKESTNDIQDTIDTITKSSRITGVYMIIATHRPTNDIISGAIKENITSRISFSVTSSMDSKIILDEFGAEKLGRYGDMLYKSEDDKNLIRIQSCLVADKDIKTIAEYWRTQTKPQYDNFNIEEKHNENNDVEEPLYDEIVKFVISTGKASASLLQRRFRLGYNRAAHAIDLLERNGIIGPSNGSAPRDVLIKQEEETWQ